MNTTHRVAFLPGVGNSEPEHWQSHWHRSMPGSLWVEQRDWDNPVRDEWVAAALQALRSAQGPKVIVAHSLGCLLAAEVLEQAQAKTGVIAAFLVSVPDAEGPAFPRCISGFKRALDLSMPVPSCVVASTDDPYGSVAHAERVAARWESPLISVGAKGHINLKSGLGHWAEGREHFNALLSSLSSRAQ